MFCCCCFCFVPVLGLHQPVVLPHGMRDHGSLTGDQTHVSCIGRCTLNHWATEVPWVFFYLESILSDRVITLALFSLLFAWNIFFHPFIFKRLVSWILSESLIESIELSHVFLYILPIFVFWLERSSYCLHLISE